MLRRVSSVSQPILIEMYVGSDPMGEARRVTGLLGLDHVQYRWIGALLCRGIGRLKRPVVWSAQVKIADGPRRARQSNGKQRGVCTEINLLSFLTLETLNDMGQKRKNDAPPRLTSIHQTQKSPVPHQQGGGLRSGFRESTEDMIRLLQDFSPHFRKEVGVTPKR